MAYGGRPRMMTASVYVSVCVCLRAKDLGECPFGSECVFACLCGLMTVNMCSNAKKKKAKTKNFCSTRHTVFYVAPSHMDYSRYNFFCGFILLIYASLINTLLCILSSLSLLTYLSPLASYKLPSFLN